MNSTITAKFYDEEFVPGTTNIFSSADDSSFDSSSSGRPVKKNKKGGDFVAAAIRLSQRPVELVESAENVAFLYPFVHHWAHGSGFQ